MSVAFIPAIVGGIITAVAGKKIAKKHKLLGSIIMAGGAMLAGGAISGAMSSGGSAVAAAEAAPTALLGEGAATGIAEGAISAAPAAEAAAATTAASPASAGLLDPVAANMPAAASMAPTNALNLAEGTVQQAGGRTFVVQGGQMVEMPAAGGGFLGSNAGMAATMIGGQALAGGMSARENRKTTDAQAAAEKERFDRTHEAGRFDVGLLDSATTQYIGNRNAGVNLPNQPSNGLLDPRRV